MYEAFKKTKIESEGGQYRAVVIVITLLVLLSVMSASYVCAAESGTAYLATATPYYKHPVTGKIEDPGQNEGIGQGMTESVLKGGKGLIEVTDSGKFYATVRFYMMDNISNVRFWAQERGSSGWSRVSARIMQENAGGQYCSDFRMRIPSQNAILRASMYVSAMGRNVVFYIGFSNLKKGSGNFIVSVSNSAGSSGAAASKNSSGGTSAGSSQTSGSVSDSSSATGLQSGTSGETAADGTVLADENSELTADGDLLDSADGLTTSQDETAQASSSEKEESLPALSWVLVLQCILIVLVPALVVGGVLMALLIYIKNREEIE